MTRHIHSKSPLAPLFKEGNSSLWQREGRRDLVLSVYTIMELTNNTSAGSILRFFGAAWGGRGNLAGAMRGIGQEGIFKMPEEIRAAV